MSIEALLKLHGPTRAARLAEAMAAETGLKPEAARQRLSRAKPPVRRFPFPLLPKREGFFYMEADRNTERYWVNLVRDLRETGSIYGLAIDGFMARGGVVPTDEFAVVSGAPVALRGQVPSEVVAGRLIDLGVMTAQDVPGLGSCYVANRYAVADHLPLSEVRARLLADSVVLDGLREWVRRNGFASWNKIALRNDDHDRLVGQFKWDLTGPSYLLPLRTNGQAHGFFAADAFSDGRIDADQVRYFVRKAQLYRQTSKSGDLLPMMVADSFTGEALKACHRAGVLACTLSGLWGDHVAHALRSLVHTLKNAAAVAASDPEQLQKLLNDLSQIEGAAGNLRGILFELLSGHLAKVAFGGGIELGVLAKDHATGRTADIDVMCVTEDQNVCTIECKGRAPGGRLALEDVEAWLGKLPTFKAHLAQQSHLRERSQEHMLWTTGTIEPDALARLEAEKARRAKHPISWKDGQAVRDVARKRKQKVIGDALDQHFLKHPLAA